jgi:sec-independent protein translocase protein TatB
MFGISIFELLLVLIIALVVIKPKDLPKAMHSFGTLVAKVRRFYQMMQYQWTKSLEDIEEKNYKSKEQENDLQK